MLSLNSKGVSSQLHVHLSFFCESNLSSLHQQTARSPEASSLSRSPQPRCKALIAAECSETPKSALSSFSSMQSQVNEVKVIDSVVHKRNLLILSSMSAEHMTTAHIPMGIVSSSQKEYRL